MKYKYIYFDLDGTIIDSSEGVVNSAIHSLKKYNLNKYTIDELKQTLIGPPLFCGLKNLTKINDEGMLNDLVKSFREIYSTHGVFENTLFPGIVNLIEDLSNLNCHLEILTSKPQKFAEQILEQHGISQYFYAIDGAGEHDKKSSKIEKLCISIRKHPPDQCIMIGDRAEDIIAGNQNSIDTLAVTYGFDTLSNLQKENATYYVDTAHDIYTIIKGDC